MKFRILSILLIAFFVYSCTSSRDKEETYKLVWSDEFDYTGFPDSTKWSFEVEGNKWAWGNNEKQNYTINKKENAWVENGVLKITAIKEQTGDKKYSSARLRTKDKGDWLYGKIVVVAKIPDGRGLWPAIWMLPTDWVYGGWPESGEIDIMENVGYNPDTVWATVHTKAYNHIIQTQKSAGFYSDNIHDEFHKYSLEWDSTKIEMYFDDQKYFTFENEQKTSSEWPFDQKFHLLLNVAVGGNWGGLKGIDTTIFPRTMEVDYIRVYQKTK